MGLGIELGQLNSTAVGIAMGWLGEPVRSGVPLPGGPLSRTLQASARPYRPEAP